MKPFRPRPPAEAPPAAGESATQTGPRRLVVLDGDPRARAHVDSALTAQGYHVFSTGDAAAAVRVVRSEASELLLVDLAPGIVDVVPRWERRRSDADPARATRPLTEGYAILRPLEADPGPADHLVVFLPDAEAGLDRARAFRFTVQDYVPKPVQARLLLERVEEVLERIDRAARSVLPVPTPGPGRVRRPAAQPAGPQAVPAPREADTWRDAELLAEGEVAAPAFEALPRCLRTVLAVDPDDGCRGFLRRLLEPHGFTVHEAAEGEEGLRLALARRPWLIVSEVKMPGVDGFEFCRRVRNHTLLRHTPLLLFSAWDDYTERYLGLKLGADEYLSKLTPVREILIRLQLVLKRYSDVGTRTRKGQGMAGTLELVGSTAMLQMCHLSRLTGACTIRAGPRFARIVFRDGEIVSALCDEERGAHAIYTFIGWTRGHFEFVPGDASDGPPLRESFDYLLLEGCRRLDEAAAAAGA
jgi:DNA-binding response OmpR family regulator